MAKVVDAVFTCSTCDGTGQVPSRPVTGYYWEPKACADCIGLGYDLIDGCCPFCGGPVSFNAVFKTMLDDAKAQGWSPPPDQGEGPLSGLRSRILPDGILRDARKRGPHQCPEGA